MTYRYQSFALVAILTACTGRTGTSNSDGSGGIIIHENIGGGGSGGTSSSISATATATASSAASSTGSGPFCGPGEKLCPLGCASLDSPDTGCAANTCLPCPKYANSTPTCAAGACSIACDPGWTDCVGGIFDGCETDLMTSLAHCGSCGNACAAGQGCANGSCYSCGDRLDCTILGTQSDLAGYWLAWPFSLSHTTVVSSIDLPAPFGARVFILNDSAGQPSTSILNVLLSTPSPGLPPSWNTAKVSQVTLAGGATYWLAVGSQTAKINIGVCSTGPSVTTCQSSNPSGGTLAWSPPNTGMGPFPYHINGSCP